MVLAGDSVWSVSGAFGGCVCGDVAELCLVCVVMVYVVQCRVFVCVCMADQSRCIVASHSFGCWFT